MTDTISSMSPIPDENDDLPQPTPAFTDSSSSTTTKDASPSPLPPSNNTPTTSVLPRSRPLSEISDNSDNRRSFYRTNTSNTKSRPTSEVREGEGVSHASHGAGGKHRMSVGEIKTITLNLNDYATTGLKSPTTASSAGSSAAPVPPSPSTKPGGRPLLPNRASSASVTSAKGKEKDVAKKGTQDEDGDDSAHVSAMYINKRQSLRPSRLSSGSYADVIKAQPSPAHSSASATASTSTSASTDHPSSTKDTPLRPGTRSKPSWLRRASGTSALRTKSKSPALNDDVETLPTSSSLPPALPPRKGKGLEGDASMGPPELPRRSSYAHVTAGPSRSRLGEGQGRPAFAPAPPNLPSRDNVGNIRTRLAAWTSAAQSSSSFSKSESSNSIASMAAGPSAYGSGHQRVPSSAQRVLGHAGSAVQKGWAGLRSRGVAGSISSMSGLGSSTRRGSMEPSGSWSSGLAVRRGSRDRTQSADTEMRPSLDGPVFEDGVVKRQPGARTGRVFGRDLTEVGRAWGIQGANEIRENEGEYEQRRRACLPALVIRTVEYLEIWGPKEEGIFRISGRASHLSRLRKEFDSGADLDLRGCHPADLDPHAVSGLFKSYLRELPCPLLTNGLTPKFEAYIRSGQASQGNKTIVDGEQEDMTSLLSQLPNAHWFLLADIVKLLELIPKHSETNRMTLNALMLSLGPSLNIPGGVLTELLEKRKELFAVPPALDVNAEALIDFGDVDIGINPPSLPAKSEPSVRSATSMSQKSEEGFTMVPVRDQNAKKRPTLPKKPSITRLLGVASGSRSASKQASMETIKSRSSVVDTLPPRIDVPSVQTSPLMSFDAPVRASSDPVVVIDRQAGEEMENLQERASTDSGDRVSTDNIKPPLTPTPIADRFSSAGSMFPSLRATNSIANSSTTSLSDSGSATMRRRVEPVFFSAGGAAGGERHARSHSATPAVSTAASTRNEAKDETDGNDTAKEQENPNNGHEEGAQSGKEVA